MSTSYEKIESIHHAIDQAKKIIVKLEAIKSVSKLHKSQEYELEMAKECVRKGEEILTKERICADVENVNFAKN